ncbi:MAG: hypothetical protein FWC97_01930 [Treponema sp.]|nr:hypothetical protein [Treponema sp.]
MKPAKIPSIFKKPIKKKAFENNFAKLIEHPADKKFFTACFELKTITVKGKETECYVIRSDINKESANKLKSLLKVIKLNRKGTINYVPLVFASIVVSAAVLFFIIFANPLLGRAMEMGLESVFEARADVNNFRFSLIDFEVSMTGITVANRDRPMTNLFDMGRTVISLRPEAVLRGKIYIEEIRADTIRFGTPRTVSGALPFRPPRERTPTPPRETPPLVNLQNFDAMALLNQEFERLSSPRIFNEAIDTYNEIVTTWQGNIDATITQTEELRTAALELQNFNVSDLNLFDPETINVIRRTITDVNNLITTAQTAGEHAVSLVSGIEADIATAVQLEANARNAITDDLNHFRSFIDLSSGTAFGILESVLGDILTDAAREYIEYGLIALEALQKIKTIADDIPRNERPPREERSVFRGRNVSYNVVNFPSFYLGVLTSDFTLNSWNWAVDLRNVSSNPNFTAHSPYANNPARLRLAFSEVGGNLNRDVAFNGIADFRTHAAERFNTEVNATGFPISLGAMLSNIGINGFSGESNFGVSLAGLPNGNITTRANILINESSLFEPYGTIANAIDTAIRQADNVNLGVQHIFNVGRSDEFSLTSNIHNLFAQALEQTVRAYAARAMEEIERVLRQRIDEFIDGRFDSREQVDQLLAIARGDRELINQIGQNLTDKRSEFEQTLRSITGAVEDAARQFVDDAARQAEEAARQAREEAERQAQAAVDAAREEAERLEQAARDEAERIAQEAREEAERLAREAREEAERQAQEAARDALQNVLPGGTGLPGLPRR